VTTTAAATRTAAARPRRRLLVVGLAFLAAIVSTPARALLPAEAPFAPPVADAATTGLTMTADTRYTVDPAKRRVHVVVDLSATNHRSDTKTHRYFFDRMFLAVQPGTTGYKITSSGTKPTVRVDRKTATYVLLRIDFGKQLGAGATRDFKLTFDITDPGGAATRTTRIGTTLVTFGAWGFGSAGTPGGTVAVVFPPGFTVDVTSADLGAPTTDAAGNVTYATGRLANALAFFAYFIADRPGAFKETTIQVTIDGEAVPITLRAWPDDPAWAKRVGGLLKRGLPALAKDIGLPWTVSQPLTVSEAISRNAAGFAGRYNPLAGQIEIAYYATPFVVLHEAAHAWFDGSLLADRWASEGFSSWYALRAAKAIGEKKVVGDILTPALEKSRVPLNAWSAPGEDDATIQDAEYAAALALATQIGERAGPAGLTSVWQAIHEQRAAYQPLGSGGSLETSAEAPDWRGLLDLLEERTPASYDDLWRTWVVRASDEGLLDARATSRERYATVVGRAEPWLLPRVVRDALRAWQFDQANELFDGATTALDARDNVAQAATAAGLTPPSMMETDFEGQRGFAAASAESDAELAAITVYRDAAASRPADPDLLSRIGLWNSDPTGALANAASAFAGGDLPGSAESAAYAKKIWTTAADVGRNRVLAVVASCAAILLAGWLVLRAMRDRSVRRRSLVLPER
jgi:hypothetical protein